MAPFKTKNKRALEAHLKTLPPGSKVEKTLLAKKYFPKSKRPLIVAVNQAINFVNKEVPGLNLSTVAAGNKDLTSLLDQHLKNIPEGSLVSVKKIAKDLGYTAPTSVERHPLIKEAKAGKGKFTVVAQAGENFNAETYLPDEELKKLFTEANMDDQSFLKTIKDRTLPSGEKYNVGNLRTERKRLNIPSFRAAQLSKEVVLADAEKLIPQDYEKYKKNEMLYGKLKNKVINKRQTIKAPSLTDPILYEERKKQRRDFYQENKQRIQERSKVTRRKQAAKMFKVPNPRGGDFFAKDAVWLNLFDTARLNLNRKIDPNAKTATFADVYPNSTRLNIINGTRLNSGVKDSTGREILISRDGNLKGTMAVDEFIDKYKPGDLTFDQTVAEFEKRQFISDRPELRAQLNKALGQAEYGPLGPAEVHHPRTRRMNAYLVEAASTPSNRAEANALRKFNASWENISKLPKNDSRRFRLQRQVHKDWLTELSGIEEIRSTVRPGKGPLKGSSLDFQNWLESLLGESLPEQETVRLQPILEKAINRQSQTEFGRDACAEGCFIKTTKENPGLVRRALGKLPKGGRLGMIAGAIGAVGAGTYAMMGGAKAEEAPTTDQMTYNATEGKFVEANGDPADQSTVLNWIADHPTTSGFAALPGAIGLGYIATAAAEKGKIPKAIGNVGKYMMSWKVGIPAMMIPHKLHEWKRGDEPAELITDPWNALWAVGIRSPKQMSAVKAYYDDMLKQGRQGLNMSTLKNLKNVQGWKNLPGAFKTALMSPAATGTNWAMGTQLRRPFVAAMKALDKPAAAGVGALAKRIGLRAALLPLGVLGAVPAGIATLGFLAADFAYGQYKDWRDGKAITESMLKRGNATQEDADNYMTLIKQGSIPFGLGNRMFGSDNMNIAGVDMNAEQQRQTLAGLEDQLDVFQQGRQTKREKLREDDFDFGDPGGLFSEGGRVGMKFGGPMDRREFMKWLLGIAAAGGAALKGVWKPGGKKVAEEVVKQIPKEFTGVPGMPEWFFRAVQKIKTHGKLLEMADKDYVAGDIYEMMIPIKEAIFSKTGPYNKIGEKTVLKKVTLEENPLSGEIEMSWEVPDFDGDMIRQINFKPGQAGFQKFGVDDAEAAAQGMTEFQRVKVEEPEFNYSNPDQSKPYRDEVEYLDIFADEDDVVRGLADLAGNKPTKMVAKDGSIIDVSKEGKGVDEAYQKKLYKDIEGEEAIIPEPKHAGVDHLGNVYGEEEYLEIIAGDIPDHLLKKAEGGIIETGNIARRPGAVPPLSGPDPQGSGIVGLFSNPKQVNVGL